LLAVCIRHIAMGRSDFSGSRQSRQLVALSCRRASLSGLSHDLAAAALALFGAAFDRAREKCDLELRGPFGLRDNARGDTIPFAPGRNQRLAALRRTGPGLRSHDNERRSTYPAATPDCAYAGLHPWAEYGVSRQHGVDSGRLRRSAREFLVTIRLVCCDVDRVADGHRDG